MTTKKSTSVKKESKEEVAVLEKEPYFALPSERIFIRYVKRQSGFVTSKSHIAYGGKLEGASDELPAKQDRAGKYIDPLTREEHEGLEALMGVDPNYLSVHKPLNNFWDSMKVRLTKEGVFLDLSNAYDFIKYKVLLTYDDYVSPSILNTNLKKSYRYEIVRGADENIKDKEEVDYNIQAYRWFGKIEDSREQLAGIIQVMTGRSVATTDHDWLIKEVGKIVKDKPRRFVEILSDTNYKDKLFIEKALSRKKVVKRKNLYYTEDGIDICEEGEQPTLMNAIKFLKNIKNQDVKLAIEAGLQ